MNLNTIIGAIAGRADELFSDARNTKEARTMIGEVLTKEYPKLGLTDRNVVTANVLEILQEEGFFEASSGPSGEWSEGGEEGEEE